VPPLKAIASARFVLHDRPQCNEPCPQGASEPVAIDSSRPLLVEKNDGQSCEGGITGVFPAMLCNPVPAEMISCSTVKSLCIN